MLASSNVFQFSPTGRPVALIDDLKALGRFRSKMAEQDLPVNVARMMFDRPYAFERIALGHSSADEDLQRLALQLFAQYAKDDDAAH
ncbi:MAG TPA: hypothetical protein VFL64_02920 [Rhizobacter sp.]|nr:hypothetical protein [Rhizobacter sp.]